MSGGDNIFRTHPDWRWGLPSLLYSGYRVFTGGQQPVHGVDHQPPSSAKVKEKVELYIYSTMGLHGLF